MKLIRSHPAVGWVRGDQVLSDSAKELLALRKRIGELEAELEHSEAKPPAGTENLAHGDDLYEILFEFKRHKGEYDFDGKRTTGRTRMTWNKIFYVVSPLMIDEANERSLKTALGESISANTGADLRKRFAGESLKGFSVQPESFHTVLVQLRALGLITKCWQRLEIDPGQRSVFDPPRPVDSVETKQTFGYTSIKRKDESRGVGAPS